MVCEKYEKGEADPLLSKRGREKAEKIREALLKKKGLQEFRRSRWIVGSGTGRKYRDMRKIIFGSRVDGFEAEELGTPEVTLYDRVIFANGKSQPLGIYLDGVRFMKLYCRVPSLIRKKIKKVKNKKRNLLLITGKFTLYSLGVRDVKPGDVYSVRISKYRKLLKIRRLHLGL